MTPNETVLFAKMNQLDFCLEIMMGFYSAAGMSKSHAAILRKSLLKAVENPTLSGSFDTQDEQDEAATLSELQTMMSDFVERIAARESELRSGWLVPETPKGNGD